MFTIRYSQTDRVVRWDENTFTDCRPCEVDEMQDEIIDLASSLTVPSTFYKDTSNLTEEQYGRLPQSLHYARMARKGPLLLEWTLGEANEKAKLICQEALNKSRNGYRHLQHAKSLYDEFKREGRLDKDGKYAGDYTSMYAGLYDLENIKKENSWDPEPEAMSWGDATVRQ